MLPLALALVALDPAPRAELAADSAAFYAGPALVTRLHFGPGAAKPYCFPLNAPGPNGDVAVSRAWPLEPAPPGGSVDHPHHKSLWFGHGEVTAEGVPGRADFWAEDKGHGVIRLAGKVAPPESKAGRVSVTLPLVWETAGGAAVVDEVRTVSLELVGGGRLLVVRSELKPHKGAVTFGDTKEGLFGLRVADRLNLRSEAGPVLESSGGKAAAAPAKDNLAVWGEVADWHDSRGRDGVGVALFDHPANRPRAAWHSRAYGLVAANPFGGKLAGFPGKRGEVGGTTLKPGEALVLRYGVFLHGSGADIGAAFKRFAE